MFCHVGMCFFENGARHLTFVVMPVEFEIFEMTALVCQVWVDWLQYPQTP